MAGVIQGLFSLSLEVPSGCHISFPGDYEVYHNSNQASIIVNKVRGTRANSHFYIMKVPCHTPLQKVTDGYTCIDVNLIDSCTVLRPISEMIVEMHSIVNSGNADVSDTGKGYL